MRFAGTCPHCKARLEVASPPPPLLTCTSCSGRCTVVVPENATEGLREEVELVLLARQEAHARASWLAHPVWKRLLLCGVVAVCTVALAFLVIGLLHLFAPGPVAEGATIWFTVAAGLLLGALPLAAVLSLAVVWFLFGRRGRSAPGFDLARSVLAVTAGVATVAVAGFLLLSLRLWIDELLPVGLNRSVSIACDVLAGLGAGWITVRLSPSAPYRHALAVGIVIVLGVAVLVLPLVADTPWLPLAASAYLAYVPVLLLGAWLGVRAGSAARPRGTG